MQNTFLFKDENLNIAQDNEEIETNIEVNNLYMKDFEYKLTNNFLSDKKIFDNNNTISGVLGLGTLHGKNMFMDQMKSKKLIKKKKVYFCLTPF